MKKIFILMVILSAAFRLSAQTSKEPLQFDDIQVDVKRVHLDKKTDTLLIELFLISLDKNPREFKLNVFATQVLDAKAKANFISTISIGRVFVRLQDRQNYLHYLLQPDVPALMTIRVDNWSKTNSTTKEKLKLVFEDSNEKGKYNEFLISLHAAN